MSVPFVWFFTEFREMPLGSSGRSTGHPEAVGHDDLDAVF
jgi:hypothetical protein